MAKIVDFAVTEKDIPSFKLNNAKLFSEKLRELSGDLKITIETIDGDATDAQIYHFRTVVVPAFIFEASKAGSDYNEIQAEKMLVGMFTEHSELYELVDNGKTEMSKLIDKSKQWICEFFKTSIF